MGLKDIARLQQPVLARPVAEEKQQEQAEQQQADRQPGPEAKSPDPGALPKSAKAQIFDRLKGEKMGNLIGKVSEATKAAFAQGEMEDRVKEYYTALRSTEGQTDETGRYIVISNMLAHRLSTDPEDPWRIYLPASMRVEASELFHNTLAHMGPRSTQGAMARYFWWPNMYKFVTRLCRGCDKCQRANDRGPMSGKLFQQDAPKRRWQRVYMDLMTHLPLTPRGRTAVLLVIDALTRRSVIIPTTTDASATKLAELLLQHVVAYYGVWDEIGTDRDSKFLGEVMQALFKLLGMKHYATTSHHQRAEPTERWVQMACRLIRTRCMEDPTNWDLYTAPTQLALNSYINRSIGCSAAKADQGWDLQLIPDVKELAPACLKEAGFDRLAEIQNENLQILRDAHDDAISEYKSIYDRTHKRRVYTPGDKVLLSMKDQKKYNSKFSERKVGPFTVLEALSHQGVPNGNYLIDLPKSMSRIHPVFHESFMSPYVGQLPGQTTNNRPGPITPEEFGNNVFEVESIKSHKFDGRKKLYLFEVAWKGYDSTQATWEPAENFLSEEARAALRDYCKVKGINMAEIMSAVCDGVLYLDVYH